MIEIIKVLMSYGMDFEYENNGSKGERVTSFECSVVVQDQGGNLFLEIRGKTVTYKTSESSLNAIKYLVDQHCIEETT